MRASFFLPDPMERPFPLLFVRASARFPCCSSPRFDYPRRRPSGRPWAASRIPLDCFAATAADTCCSGGHSRGTDQLSRALEYATLTTARPLPTRPPLCPSVRAPVTSRNSSQGRLTNSSNREKRLTRRRRIIQRTHAIDTLQREGRTHRVMHGGAHLFSSLPPQPRTTSLQLHLVCMRGHAVAAGAIRRKGNWSTIVGALSHEHSKSATRSENVCEDTTLGSPQHNAQPTRTPTSDALTNKHAHKKQQTRDKERRQERRSTLRELRPFTGRRHGSESKRANARRAHSCLIFGRHRDRSACKHAHGSTGRQAHPRLRRLRAPAMRWFLRFLPIRLCSLHPPPCRWPPPCACCIKVWLACINLRPHRADHTEGQSKQREGANRRACQCCDFEADV